MGLVDWCSFKLSVWLWTWDMQNDISTALSSYGSSPTYTDMATTSERTSYAGSCWEDPRPAKMLKDFLGISWGIQSSVLAACRTSLQRANFPYLCGEACGDGVSLAASVDQRTFTYDKLTVTYRCRSSAASLVERPTVFDNIVVPIGLWCQLCKFAIVVLWSWLAYIRAMNPTKWTCSL